MGANVAFWQGTFGTDYTARNRVQWPARIPFWRGILDRTCARSICEVGTNAAWNLTAIKYADQFVQTYGCEVNPMAHAQAVRAGFRVALQDADTYLADKDREFDVVATCGMLIHVAPADLTRTMDAIIKASANYVLAVEYAAEQEEEVLYRGYTDKLWRRPYGQLYEKLGLQLVAQWDAEGFDRCHAWLLRRP